MSKSQQLLRRFRLVSLGEVRVHILLSNAGEHPEESPKTAMIEKIRAKKIILIVL